MSSAPITLMLNGSLQYFALELISLLVAKDAAHLQGTPGPQGTMGPPGEQGIKVGNFYFIAFDGSITFIVDI